MPSQSHELLLTGASGFLGRMFQNHLPGKYHVTSLGRKDSESIICDLAESVPKLTKVHLVIHAAGKAHTVPKSKKQEEMFFKVNLQGTRNLLKGLEQSETLPMAIVFISTVAVYGLEKGENIVETVPLNGGTPYALSKIKAERVLLDWGKKHRVKVSILRLPLVAGPGPPGNLGAIIRAIRIGYYCRPGNGSARRSLVLAKDVAEVVENVVKYGGIYHLTDGCHPSFKELELCIAKQFGKSKIRSIPNDLARYIAKVGDYIPFSPLNSDRLEKMTSTLTFSDEKARRIIGWKPRSVLENFKIS